MKLKSNRINVLFSYAYLRSNPKLESALLKLSEEGYINLLIDSGAFTAFKSGSPIDFSAYKEACKSYDKRCWQYVTVDVIGNKEQTQENFNKLVQAGLIPMPVLTIDDDIHTAKDYVNVNPHIGVPGGVMTKGDWIRQRFQQVHKITQGKARIHGLGYVKFPDMYQLPLSTVDSSTWSGGQRFGRIQYFDQRKGIQGFSVSQLKDLNFANIPEKLRDMYVKAGLNPNDRFNEDYYTGRNSVNSYYTVNAYMDLHRCSKRNNLNFFFACTDHGWLTVLASVLLSKARHGGVNYFYMKKCILQMIEEFKTDSNMTLLKEGLALT